MKRIVECILGMMKRIGIVELNPPALASCKTHGTSREIDKEAPTQQRAGAARSKMEQQRCLDTLEKHLRIVFLQRMAHIFAGAEEQHGILMRQRVIEHTEPLSHAREIEEVEVFTVVLIKFTERHQRGTAFAQGMHALVSAFSERLRLKSLMHIHIERNVGFESHTPHFKLVSARPIAGSKPHLAHSYP